MIYNQSLSVFPLLSLRVFPPPSWLLFTFLLFTLLASSPSSLLFHSSPSEMTVFCLTNLIAVTPSGLSFKLLFKRTHSSSIISPISHCSTGMKNQVREKNIRSVFVTRCYKEEITTNKQLIV